MCEYHLLMWEYDEAMGSVISLKTWTSACDGAYLKREENVRI